jgi:hypothetical protein
MAQEPRVESAQPDSAASPASGSSAPDSAARAAVPWRAILGSRETQAPGASPTSKPSPRRLAELHFNLEILRRRTQSVLAGLDPSGTPDERALFRLTQRLEQELTVLRALAGALSTE